MEENRSWDHFAILTKEEIIEYCKNEIWFQAPELRRVAHFRYDREFKRILNMQKEHLNKKESSKIAALIDENAGKINSEKDISKIMKLWDERTKLFHKLDQIHAEYDKLDKKLEAIQKWYDKIINKSNNPVVEQSKEVDGEQD